MFKNLFDLSYKRSGMEAFGFYIVYTILFMLLAGLVNAVVYVIITPDSAAATFEEGYQAGKELAKYVIPVFSLITMGALSFGTVAARKLTKDVQAILLAVFATLLTPLIGCIIGMIPVVVITTLESKTLE